MALPTDHFIRFERVDSVARSDHGLLAELHGEQLRVDVIAPDVVRIKISRGGSFDEAPTYAVNVDPLHDAVDFEVEIGAEQARLRTAALVVTVGVHPFRIDVHRPDGTAVIETAADRDGQYWAYATLNDSFTLRRRCHREDAIFGLGEKSGGQNRKGRDFTLWNTDVLSPSETKEFTDGKAAGDPRGDRKSVEFDPFYVSIPFYYHHQQPSGAVAGAFIDNSYRSHFDFTPAEEFHITYSGGQYTEYVFAGPEMPAILESYTALTGRAAPPPLWSLGFHQCRWFPYTQDTLLALGQQLRDDDLPCDALWLDIDYMDGYRVFTWNQDRYPDPPAMLEQLRQQGLRVITIIDPGVKYEPGYSVFDQGLERDVFCKTEGGDTYIGQVWPGNTAFPDFVTEEGRAWWGELNAAHVRSGLAGIWNDMNEPATGNIPALPMRFGQGEYSHERYRNQYALLMAMGTREGLLATMPELRTFILSRSGFAGIQRYAANWMGDNLSRWDHLWLSIPMATGFGISGQPFVGADVGGFDGNTNAELFLRWVQYGVLTPFCRNHTVDTSIDQYAWSFGPAVEDLVRDAIKLRYRLLPYIYASFLRATATGEPVQRPLVFDYQSDYLVRDIDDEYLFGPDLLVAPVLEPAMTARQVYLPVGGWYDWETDEYTEGARYVVASTPMERIPVYARAGAVIPMWTEAPPSTDGYHPEAVELHLFVPGGDYEGTSTLVEDDGLTLGGGHFRTALHLTRTRNQINLRGTVEGTGFPEFRRRTLRLLVHGATPAAVTVDGIEFAATEGAFVFANAGAGFELSFEI
jgi:alpha-glucosidase